MRLLRTRANGLVVFPLYDSGLRYNFIQFILGLFNPALNINFLCLFDLSRGVQLGLRIEIHGLDCERDHATSDLDCLRLVYI